MPRYSDNLGLILPLESENFDIKDWNSNMRVLDEAYALLTDPSGGTKPIASDLITYDNTESGLDAANVKDALDLLAQGTTAENLYFMDITEDTTITVATYSHVYLVLSFGETVPSVSFVQSIPDSGRDFVWEGGQPQFQPNSTYELSFLHLDCMWFKR